METAVWNLVCDDVRPEELPALSACREVLNQVI